MFRGSLMWAGVAFLFYLSTFAISFLLLGKKNWLEGRALETITKIAEGYVEAGGKQISKSSEVLARFFHNWRFKILLYIIALVLMRFAPNLKFVVVGLAGILVLIDAAMMAFTAVLTRQLETGVFDFLISLLPHGILETLAIFFIYGHAIWLVDSKAQFSLVGSLVYMAVATVTLLVAALIEVNITPKVIKKYLKP